MIICIGTITSPSGTSYQDPYINTYFLSYNEEFGIMAFPQIVENDSIVDQLNAVIIPAPGSNKANRTQIQAIVLMTLQNDFPNCTFEII